MVGHHQRNVGPMQLAPRCGARTRAGTECAAPKVAGAARCRMHGGRGSGAPKGNCNALKSGLYTARMLERRREVAQVIGDVRSLLAEIDLGSG